LVSVPRPTSRPKFKTIRDFGPRTDLVWSATEHEGAYELEVTARDLVSGEAASQTSLFEATPLASISR